MGALKKPARPTAVNAPPVKAKAPAPKKVAAVSAPSSKAVPAMAKVSSGVSLTQLVSEAAPLVALVQEVSHLVQNGGGDESVRKASQGAAATLRKAVEDFTSAQASQVALGQMSLTRWRENLALYTKQAASMKKDAQERTSVLYKLTHAVGGAAESAAGAINGKIAELRKRYNEIASSRASVEKLKASLRGKAISAAASAELFGAPAQRAEATWKQLGALLGQLEKGATLLTGGAASPVGLGALLPAGAAGAVAAVAIAGALAASLWAYYSHAGEVARSEVARLELTLVKEGKTAEVLQLRKLRNDADAARLDSEVSPFAALATAARWAGVGLLAVGAGWVAREALRPRGPRNP
jgi:hypothetical protein